MTVLSGSWQDISVTLDDDLPVWPRSPGVRVGARLSIAGGCGANVSQLEIDVHTGTHVDAPLHFFDGAASVADLGLHPFVGSTAVVDTGDAADIDEATLAASGVPPGVERILLRTANSHRPTMYREAFDRTYAGLTVDGARWLAALNIALVGIDYLSVQRFDESADVHRSLLGAGTAILEGICLRDVEPGLYYLVCLPLKLAGTEGAPARAILMRPNPDA
jgi:arylformamidase